MDQWMELYLVTMFCAEAFGLYIWSGLTRADDWGFRIKQWQENSDTSCSSDIFLPNQPEPTSGSREELSMTVRLVTVTKKKRTVDTASDLPRGHVEISSHNKEVNLNNK